MEMKAYLNAIYSRVCIGKHLSNIFPIQNGLIVSGVEPFFRLRR
jgi:hypothetical protein